MNSARGRGRRNVRAWVQLHAIAVAAVLRFAARGHGAVRYAAIKSGVKPCSLVPLSAQFASNQARALAPAHDTDSVAAVGVRP